MKIEEIDIEVQNIVRNVLKVNTLILNDQTKADDIQGWDSLAQMNIMMALEALFDIKFTLAELSNIENIGVLKQKIFSKLNSKN